MITTRHALPMDLCHAIQKVAAADGLSFTARPHNQFDPERTIWWLVPSVDWPAYRYVKPFFDWRDDHRTSLWAGVYVEKGVDPSIASYFTTAKGKRWIMTRDWDWHEMIRRLQGGQIERSVETIANAVPVPLHFRVDGAYASEDRFDPDMAGYQSDDYLFARTSENARLGLVGTPKTGGKVLGDLATVASIGDLRRELVKLTNNAWVWVDFMIMVPVEPGDAPTPGAPAPWRDAELWARVLKPLYDALT